MRILHRQRGIDLAPGVGANDKVILIDGVCKLCNAWSNFIIEHDSAHRFKLASVQSDQGQAILLHFNYPIDKFDTMLVIDGTKSLEKSAAFLQVMNTLGYPWKLLLITKLIPRPIRDWLYDRIALNRYALFGKYEYCVLPTPDHKERYLDGQ